MYKNFIALGSLLAALAVVLGAFAAHALKTRLTADSLAVFETAVRYQMYHAFAIIIVGILHKEFPSKNILLAGKLFLWGIILFSGSLYMLTFIKAIESINFLWVGAFTPLGGACFIGGWVVIYLGIKKK